MLQPDKSWRGPTPWHRLEGAPDDSFPVACVSWNDAKAYISWLNEKISGGDDGPYRLLSEAEWEYAARAGSKDADSEKMVDVGSFKPNASGLYNMHGNVWEWVEDCYVESYGKMPTDSSSVLTRDGCPRVLRGGGVANPHFLRFPHRFKAEQDYRYEIIGFRLARTLPEIP